VLELAADLRTKSPAVLRGTKETLKHVALLSPDEAYEYIQARREQLRFRDAEKTRARAMKGFLDDKAYKPGFTPVKRD